MSPLFSFSKKWWQTVLYALILSMNLITTLGFIWTGKLFRKTEFQLFDAAVTFKSCNGHQNCMYRCNSGLTIITHHLKELAKIVWKWPVFKFLLQSPTFQWFSLIKHKHRKLPLTLFMNLRAKTFQVRSTILKFKKTDRKHWKAPS